MKREEVISVIVGVLFALSIVVGLINVIREKPKPKVVNIPEITSLIKPSKYSKKDVPVIYIKGTLEFGYTDPSIFSTGVDKWVSQIRELIDEDIKAVILKINSPGGTVAASQELYQAIRDLRKSGKFVIAVIEDVGASGGYYIASACNYIIARPGSITGSIGVISIVPNIKNLMTKVGISVKVVKSGKFKDMGSSFREMTPEEEQLVQNIINKAYQQFFNAVMTGRKGKITPAELKSIADGRTIIGEDAVKYGLIDELGGVEEAKRVIKEKFGFEPILKISSMERLEDVIRQLLNIEQKKSHLSVESFLSSIKKPTLAYIYLGGM